MSMDKFIKTHGQPPASWRALPSSTSPVDLDPDSAVKPSAKAVTAVTKVTPSAEAAVGEETKARVKWVADFFRPKKSLVGATPAGNPPPSRRTIEHASKSIENAPKPKAKSKAKGKAKAMVLAEAHCAEAQVRDTPKEEAQTPDSSNSNEIVPCQVCSKKFPKCETYRLNNKTDKRKCKQCNRDQKKLYTIYKDDDDFLKDFKQMSKAEIKEFMEQNSEKTKKELKQAMKSNVEKHHTKKTEWRNGRGGDFQPLSVYKMRGYDDQAIDNLEKNCEQVWNNSIQQWTYCLDIVSKHKDNTEMKSQSLVELYRPKPDNEEEPAAGEKDHPEAGASRKRPRPQDEGSPARRPRRSLVKKNSEATLQQSSSTSPSKPRRIKNRVKREGRIIPRKVPKLTKQQINALKKRGCIVMKLAMAVREILGKLIRKAEQKANKSKVPTYIIEDANEKLSTISEICSAYETATDCDHISFKGLPTGQLSEKKATEACKAAENTSDNLQTMIEIAADIHR